MIKPIHDLKLTRTISQPNDQISYKSHQVEIATYNDKKDHLRIIEGALDHIHKDNQPHGKLQLRGGRKQVAYSENSNKSHTWLRVNLGEYSQTV
jgi:hypothetical protein